MTRSRFSPDPLAAALVFRLPYDSLAGNPMEEVRLPSGLGRRSNLILHPRLSMRTIETPVQREPRRREKTESERYQETRLHCRGSDTIERKWQ